MCHNRGICCKFYRIGTVTRAACDGCDEGEKVRDLAGVTDVTDADEVEGASVALERERSKILARETKRKGTYG
jgi:hypothetical protein